MLLSSFQEGIALMIADQNGKDQHQVGVPPELAGEVHVMAVQDLVDQAKDLVDLRYMAYRVLQGKPGIADIGLSLHAREAHPGIDPGIQIVGFIGAVDSRRNIKSVAGPQLIVMVSDSEDPLSGSDKVQNIVLSGPVVKDSSGFVLFVSAVDKADIHEGPLQVLQASVILFFRISYNHLDWFFAQSRSSFFHQYPLTMDTPLSASST